MRTQQQAGFVYLSQGKYQKASKMLQQGNLDVRQVLTEIDDCTKEWNSNIFVYFKLRKYSYMYVWEKVYKSRQKLQTRSWFTATVMNFHLKGK